MGLRLTLKPNERVLINGCVVRNSDRRQTLTIENTADIVREAHLLRENEARTPVKEVYFFIQASLLDAKVREKLVPVVLTKLAQLTTVFHDDMSNRIMEAASFVSQADFYKAMRCLQPVMAYEEKLLERIQARNVATAAE